jgi:flagellar assembly protein FliH
MSSRVIKGYESTLLEPAGSASDAGNGVRNSTALEGQTAEPAREPEVPSEELTQRVFQDGYDQGRAAARAEYAAMADSLRQQVADGVGTLARERPRLRASAEADVVKLALAISRRVIRRELAIDPTSIQGIVRVAIDTINNRDLVRVRVHPDLQSAVQGKLRETHLSHVEVVSDPAFRIGDIVFQTDQGELDCSVESQLKEIDLGIADRLGR